MVYATIPILLTLANDKRYFTGFELTTFCFPCIIHKGQRQFNLVLIFTNLIIPIFFKQV